MAMQGLFDSLERTVRGLSLPKTKTQWGDYYEHTNYTDAALKAKGELVVAFLQRLKPHRVVDLGSNDGWFSRVAAKTGAMVISSDIDPLAVESNYQQMRRAGEKTILPMLVDLANPSPAMGWASEERQSFGERAHSDVAMALALIHHLAIAGNVPMEMVADYFASLAPYLIIEFVPKEDSQVKRLLATREDIFPDYTPEGFVAAFAKPYEVLEQRAVAGTVRTLYLMRRRESERT